MADNIDVTPGTGKTIAAEDLAGALVQRVKLVLGNLDTDDGDISTTNPIPVTGSITATNSSITATGSAVPVGASYVGMDVAGNLVGLEGTANGLKVDGSAVTQPVSIATMPTTPVTGTFWQATQPVSIASSVAVTGPLTDTQLRASAVPVSAASLPLPTGAATSALQTTGNGSLSSIDGKIPALGQALSAASVPVVLTAAQLTTLTPLSSVSVSNFPASQAVTGTFWQATQPVSGTVAVSGSVAVTGPLTDTQLRATPVPVSGTVTANAGTGTFAVSAASLPLPTGAATSALQTTGNSSLSSIDGKLGALGQKTMAGSAPIVIASDQSNVPVSQATASNLNAQVVGNVASGAADSGNPVKVGGVYNATPPTLSNGQRVDLQTNVNGHLLIGSLPSAISGNITNTQNVSINIDGYSSISIEITGTWTGTLVFETLVGSTWSAADCFGTITEVVSQSTTVNGVFSFINLAGITSARVRGATVLSGTAAVVLNTNNGEFTYPIFARSVGNSIGSYGIQMGGVDATTNTFQFQKVNTLGAAGVYLESSNKTAYKGTIVPVTPPATPTDIVNIAGSATKTIRITKITLGSTQTTGGINDWYLIKRSTANTGGTSTIIVDTPLDSTFPAATATLRRYTANATALGTVTGNLSIENILSPTSAPGTSGTSYFPHTWDFQNNPIVLRGTAESVSINFNGAALPAGLSVNATFTWTEE